MHAVNKAAFFMNQIEASRNRIVFANLGDLGDGRFRAVTHYGISKKVIQDALSIMQKVWKEAFVA
jgi:hypothetical protein